MPNTPPVDLSVPPLSLETLSQPINVGLSVETLLKELDARFPERSPQYTEDHVKLMWRGGQRDVVNWIRSRIEET
jgi:hypothetical protein